MAEDIAINRSLDPAAAILTGWIERSGSVAARLWSSIRPTLLAASDPESDR